jgi:hypothetical protein
VDFPAGGQIKATQKIKEGGFARSVRTDDRLQLPFPDLKINLIDRLQAPEVFAQIFGLKVHGFILLSRFSG